MIIFYFLLYLILSSFKNTVAVSNPHSANFINTVHHHHPSIAFEFKFIFVFLFFVFGKASACDAAVRESRASLARLERLIGRAQLFAK